MLFRNVIRLNGIYDILCGLNLLNVIKLPFLDTIHTQMFHHVLIADDFTRRLLAYWIITYGIIRLCGEKRSHLISLSYYLETLCLLNEVPYHPQYIRLFTTAVISSYFGHINILMDLKDVND